MVDNLQKVLSLVQDVSHKWFNLGLQLGIKECDLKCIECDYKDVQSCLREMLSVWLKMVKPCPSWERLLSSLSHSSVGNPALAQKIRKDVGIPEEGQGLASASTKQTGWIQNLL